jgi:hypothetical protein
MSLRIQLHLRAGNDIGPGNDVERAFAIFVVVGGACFYAIIVGESGVREPVLRGV